MTEAPFPSDADLTAFLDGELSAAEQAQIAARIAEDPAVAERLRVLERASLPLAAAFAPLLDQAPTAHLQAMLDRLPAPAAAQAAPSARPLHRRGALGALAAALVGGAVLDRLWLTLGAGADDDGSDWQAVVAQYMALYTPETLDRPETLAGNTPGAAAETAQLALINQRLGLSLTPEALALPTAAFRRAQLLAYDDRPLAQITYVDGQGAPLALCILRQRGTPQGISSSRRQGLNIASWAGSDHAALVIGHLPAGEIKALADRIQGRIAL